MPEDDCRSFLSRPLQRGTGVPLRAQAHSRILDGIRAGVFQPNTMIPAESELGRLMGVSRTVVREALMLLEEDGFLVARRGIGRFVADALPTPGLQHLRPMEQLLASPGLPPVEARRTETARQSPSSTFVSEGLGIETSAPSWFFETVLLREDRPIALCQEHLAAEDPGHGAADDGAPGRVDRARQGDVPADRTVLAVLIGRYGSAVGPATTTLTTGTVGVSRAAALRTGGDEPAIVLTQIVPVDGRPFYLAKHLVLNAAGALSLIQHLP